MIETPDNTSRTTEDKRHWLDHAAVWAAGAAALAAGAAAAVGAWQGYIANKALAIARQSNEIQTRPYVKIDLLPETFAIGPVPGRGGSPMSMQFKVTNTGKLPAAASIQGTASWISIKHPADMKVLQSFNNLGHRFLFADQDSGALTIYSNGLSDGELLDLKANTARSFSIRAEVLYGPDVHHVADRSARVCYNYLIVWDGSRYTLGTGEPEPEEGCNTAR